MTTEPTFVNLPKPIRTKRVADCKHERLHHRHPRRGYPLVMYCPDCCMARAPTVDELRNIDHHGTHTDA